MVTPRPETTEVYGLTFSAANAYWCDMCGCLFTFDQIDGKTVMDRFEYLSPYAVSHQDCECHDVAAAHDASSADSE